MFEGPCLLPKFQRAYKLHPDKEPKILIIARSHETAFPDDIGDTPSALDLVGKCWQILAGDLVKLMNE